MSSNQLSVFNFNGSSLRVFGTDEKPMFLAKEVGELLGLINTREFVSTLDEDEKDTVSTTDAIGRKKEMTLINESAVYKLVFKSRKLEALQFQNWVCKEVLPSIRRTGKYELEQKLETSIGQIELLEDQVEELGTEIEELEAKIEYLQHLSNNSRNQITISERIIFLNLIPAPVFPQILNKIDNQYGLEIYHPDRKKFLRHISNISMRLSRSKRQRDGVFPMINRQQRSNMYFIEDYINFGDEIIQQYFFEKPFESWYINLNFEIPDF